MVGCGGAKEPQHVWKLFARESGDPAQSLSGGKRKQGGINEGENPKN
jgi:hypothetical protein